MLSYMPRYVFSKEEWDFEPVTKGFQQSLHFLQITI